MLPAPWEPSITSLVQTSSPRPMPISRAARHVTSMAADGQEQWDIIRVLSAMQPQTIFITLNKGYIGYRYFVDQASADPGAELIGITDGGGYYQEKLHDETWSGDGSYRLKDSGNIFGGGYVDNSSVDESNVTMYGGHVRNSLFGGGEIAAVGRGVIVASGEKNSIRNLQGIYKAGHTSVKLYEGFVHRNVFGGGRGYNNLGTVVR